MTVDKQRHGCLTAWLVVVIAGNAVVALVNLLERDVIRQQLPNAPGWAFPVLAILGVVNIICAVALFQWKKWGFYGICATTTAGLLINLSIGVGIGPSLTGLIGIALLYGVLQIGGDRKAWPQLE